MQEESVYLHKTSCDSCGSSDANAVYANGHTHCFSCNKHTFGDNKNLEEKSIQTNYSFNRVEVEYKTLPSRKISEYTSRRFGYGTNNGRHVMNYTDKDGLIVAQKFRTKDKTFSWIGDAKGSTLFGQHLVAPNPKLRIVLTEGELDALSVAEAQQNKYPVVSIPNGASAALKDVKKNLEYLMGFEEVLICFDMDEVGKEAAKKVAQLFPPNTAKIVSLPLKDASDMLVAGRTGELIKAFWDAKPYKPDGILSGDEVINRLLNKPKDVTYVYPKYLPKLQEMTKGFRVGALEVFAAGTGSGKTTFIKQMQHSLFSTTHLNQAIIHLEEPLEDTAEGFIGIELGTRVHLDEELTREAVIESARKFFGAKDEYDNHRIQLYDAFGSLESGDLYNKIRYMVTGLGCKVIWLDHLSILVSDLDGSEDERRKIDSIMHNLKSLTIELGCYIGLIVHLNNASGEGRTFEQGKIPSLNNLRGSGGIKQLADTVIAMTRNQQDDDPIARNTTQIVVLKCRYTGQTGLADKVYYNSQTGRLEEPPEENKQEEQNGQSDF